MYHKDNEAFRWIIMEIYQFHDTILLPLLTNNILISFVYNCIDIEDQGKYRYVDLLLESSLSFFTVIFLIIASIVSIFVVFLLKCSVTCEIINHFHLSHFFLFSIQNSEMINERNDRASNSIWTNEKPKRWIKTISDVIAINASWSQIQETFCNMMCKLYRYENAVYRQTETENDYVPMILICPINEFPHFAAKLFFFQATSRPSLPFFHWCYSI